MKNTSTKLVPGVRGFHMEFANGFALSVQYGFDSYSNNTKPEGSTKRPWEFKHEELGDVTEVEVAIMDVRGFDAQGSYRGSGEWDGCQFVVIPGEVMGWVPVSKLPALMEAVASSYWETVCHILGVEADSSLFPKDGACN